MKFTKFKIAHYRSFEDEQTLRLAVPNPELPGSGITYIVGENNSGKTTIIEGLFLHNDQKIRSSERQLAAAPTFQLIDDNNKIVRNVSLVRDHSYTLTEDPLLPDDQAFSIVPSRRHWQSTVRQNQSLDVIVQSTAKETPRQANSATRIPDALRNIEANPAQYADFVNFVQRVVPEFSSYAIGYEDNEFVEYITNNNVRHKSDYLGDGVISVLRVLAHLFHPGTQPIVIDEPELSLHPLAQKRLLTVIEECARSKQIVVSTHSPYFISWNCLRNGATLNKVTKHGDQKSEIHSLQDYRVYEKLIKGANWQQPFLMDIVAKEIFFSENFLFIEGQEDVGLIRKDGQLTDTANLFGYGVRGKNSFEFALQLAKDLGMKKACVVLDAGESENRIRAELEESFRPEGYKIMQWDKEDIRDKPAYESKEKSGYFDHKGNKKPPAETVVFDESIQEINDYFDTSANCDEGEVGSVIHH